MSPPQGVEEHPRPDSMNGSTRSLQAPSTKHLLERPFAKGPFFKVLVHLNLHPRSLRTLLSMMAGQAAGVPSGNHGLFHRWGSTSLEGGC